VADLNAKVMRKIGKSRAELLETIDRPALDALPAEPYRYAECRRCTGRIGLPSGSASLSEAERHPRKARQIARELISHGLVAMARS
jgi:hypothetical protein